MHFGFLYTFGPQQSMEFDSYGRHYHVLWVWGSVYLLVFVVLRAMFACPYNKNSFMRSLGYYNFSGILFTILSYNW